MNNLGCRAVLSVSVAMVLAVCALLFAEPAVQAQAAATHFASEKQTASVPITLDVPILLYHQIGGSGSRYNLPVKNFAAQMEYLSKQGYTTVSLDQVAAALRGQGELPPCPIAITFDDGYRGAYENGLPILQQHGLRATFYLPTAYIGRSTKYMTWDQVRDLVGKGMWIGSHSISHPFLARLARLSAQRQITESKAILEMQLGIPISTFAYPYGSFSPSVERAVEEAGYTAAVWTGFGARHTSNRIYKLNRIGVYFPMSLATFRARLPKHGPTGAGACPPAP